jgi:hypothetical protein
MDNLLPRGGGAFLAEVDGNLVAIKDAAKLLVEISTHGKFRGPEFTPFPFKLVPATSDRLVDSKGRQIWSVYAEPISQEQQEEMENWGTLNQNDLLRALLTNVGGSMSDLAELLNWKMINGDPHKMRVHRVMMDLAKNKLVEKRRDGHYVLTTKGKAEAETVDAEIKAMTRKPVKPKAPKLTAAEKRKQEEERHAASAKYEEEAKAAWLKTPVGRAATEEAKERVAKAAAEKAKADAKAEEQGKRLPPGAKVLGHAPPGERCMSCGKGTEVFRIQRKGEPEEDQMHIECAARAWAKTEGTS